MNNYPRTVIVLVSIVASSYGGWITKDCHGQCGEGEGDCDKDSDCLPGFICKSGGYIGLGTDICTEDVRIWECDKFPKWLQKTYRVKAADFCKAQWDDRYFSSQPQCNDKVLPTIAFYDRSNNNYDGDSLCTINLNEAEDGNIENLCPELDSILNASFEEVWVVYIVHGFAGYSTTPLWYPTHGVGLSNRFKSAGRKIIMAEVYWNDGAKAIFDNFVPPGIVHTILSAVMGRSLPEDRAYLESVAGLLTCGPGGLGVGDVAGYSNSASNTMVIGHTLGKLAESITSASSKGNVKTFCVGHSLGGHICGFTGKTNQLDGILAIDPAGPIFADNTEEYRLNKNDAKFVQALHVDAGEFGIDLPVAHQDIYVNGGKNQPYCPGFFTEAGCSHVAFSLWFLPEVWEQSSKGNMCLANMKCSDEIEAMKHHDLCKEHESEGIEVGLLSDNPSSSHNSGFFWVGTVENEGDACYFTTSSIAGDAMDAMNKGWNDLWSINVMDYIPIIG